MSALVNALKNEHKVLVSALDEMTRLGISSKAGQAKLFSIKEALLSHLGKEDRELYPKLHKAAEKDATLKHTLDVFAKDMEGITKTALDFFGKYKEGGDSLEFAKDIGRLVGALNKRIGSEEDILYKQFEKIA